MRDRPKRRNSSGSDDQQHGARLLPLTILGAALALVGALLGLW
jgi:hypothetical protein